MTGDEEVGRAWQRKGKSGPCRALAGNNDYPGIGFVGIVFTCAHMCTHMCMPFVLTGMSGHTYTLANCAHMNVHMFTCMCMCARAHTCIGVSVIPCACGACCVYVCKCF